MTIEEIAKQLAEYKGEKIRLMEVCGSHTSAILKAGIKSILSSDIELLSGPGCPVCVTTTAYIDRLIELAKQPNTVVVTFGDMLRVPGSVKSLREAGADGAKMQMVYSPMQMVELARQNPDTNYVFAAVGFETTAPVYALLMEEVLREGLSNVRLLTAIKTMPAAISHLLANGAVMDGFLAPGHVCAVTGSELFAPLAAKYEVPFAVGGFSQEELLIALYGLLQMVLKQEYKVANYYPSVVTAEGNQKAKECVNRYFEPCDAAWRGMGVIVDSGLRLRKEYAHLDAGSDGLFEDKKKNAACRCGEILMGKATPMDCPLFGKVCTPEQPMGACMVSMEGCCRQYYE